MRKLYILRGAPASGKSTWIKKNNLSNYAISSDEIRLSIMSPERDKTGKLCIPQRNVDLVWHIINELISERMKNGELTILDSTALKTKDMQVWKKLANAFRYRVYVVDFTDVSRETCHERNVNRPEFAQVPSYVIDRFYDLLPSYEVPSSYTVLTPDQALADMSEPIVLDADERGYEKVHVIGDVHGCYSALMHLFIEKFGIDDPFVLPENELFIFVGDYLDRGIENAKTLEYLLRIYQNDNVICLEGNHEKWLDRYAHNDDETSQQFREFTKPELDASDISKKEIARFFRKLYQLLFVSFAGRKMLITHGGLSKLPVPFASVSTYEIIHGSAGRPCASEVDLSWSAFAESVDEDDMAYHLYSIHGHRDAGGIHDSDYVYSLEGSVEYGGELRSVTFNSDGSVVSDCVENDVYYIDTESVKVEDMKDMAEVIDYLRNNSAIKEKKFDNNISSFNFTRYAFVKGIWNEQTIRSRGLFIDTKNKEIVARSYNKFFNIGENQDTTVSALGDKFSYPIDVYLKENGYLGIVSYDRKNDDLFIASKSSVTGPFADWLRELIDVELSPDKREQLKNYLKDNNQSAIFEVIDIEHDRHIIEYGRSHLVLLSLIDNNIDFAESPYEKIVELAKALGIECKRKTCILNSFEEFVNWYDKVKSKGYTYDDKEIEGFVLKDANGYMVKVKTDYYNLWKTLRRISQHVWTRGSSSSIEKAVSTTEHPEIREIYVWMKQYIAELKENGVDELPNICDIRAAWVGQEKNN